jgi:uncharacterized membrane protein YciS (DUF1049 family)
MWAYFFIGFFFSWLLLALFCLRLPLHPPSKVKQKAKVAEQQMITHVAQSSNGQRED